MDYQVHTLPNGIRIIHKQTHSLVAHCGLVINAGARDEAVNEQGLAHFIEHSIFKGTSKRKTHHILSRMEHVGGELNAYTTKEDTCIYASFMHPYYKRWLDLLSDIVFNSTFPEKEIRKEKDIIIDEINSYKDSPVEQIFDDFEGVIFRDHPLGQSILGTRRTVKSLTRKSILRFIENNYLTGGMVICSVGQIPFSKLVKLVSQYFGHSVRGGSGQGRMGYTGYEPTHKRVNRRNHQAHCILGNQAYDSNHPLKTTMVLLNNILGGPGLNSRLNMAVREKHGFCYNIESHYQPYSDSGIFSIYFGTDPDYVDKTRSLIVKELLRLCHNSMGSLSLKRAKQQLSGQVAISFESNLGEMLTIGKSLLLYDKVDNLHEINRKIDLITPDMLLEAANEVIKPEVLSSLIYKPK